MLSFLFVSTEFAGSVKALLTKQTQLSYLFDVPFSVTWPVYRNVKVFSWCWYQRDLQLFYKFEMTFTCNKRQGRVHIKTEIFWL